MRFPWAAVNGQRLTLSFSPATEEDEQALLALLPDEEITDPSQLPQSIPSHLVEVVPEIRLNGEVVASGAAMNLGEEIDFNFTVSQLGYGDDTRVSSVIAGSYLALAIAGGSVSPRLLGGLRDEMLDTQQHYESGNKTQLDSLTREDYLGGIFYAGALTYFGQFDSLSGLEAQQRNGNQNLGPSAGTYGYVPQVSYFFGLPQSVEPGGVVMDLDRVSWIQGLKEPSVHARKKFNEQVGALSSALEHEVPEQMFSDVGRSKKAVSAVRALQIANSEGQKIYQITQTNRAEILPSVHHDQATMDEIRSALSAGKEVTTHTDPISVSGWTGAGYVILDPEVGDGAWKIGGGNNGSFFALVGAFFTGLLDGLLKRYRDADSLFGPDREIKFAKIARTLARGLTLVGFAMAVVNIAVDPSLSRSDKVVAIVLEFATVMAVMYAVSAIVGSALVFPVAAIVAALAAALIVAVKLIVFDWLFSLFMGKYLMTRPV